MKFISWFNFFLFLLLSDVDSNFTPGNPTMMGYGHGFQSALGTQQEISASGQLFLLADRNLRVRLSGK